MTMPGYAPSTPASQEPCVDTTLFRARGDDAPGRDRPLRVFFDGRPGHPRLFDRRLEPDLLRLTGDTGARDLLAADPGRVRRVEVGDLGSDADIDVEADLERVGRLFTTISNGRQA